MSRSERKETARLREEYAVLVDWLRTLIESGRLDPDELGEVAHILAEDES